MPKGKNRQLALEDGIFIEDRIKARDSLSEAARRLGVSASTVPREVKRNVFGKKPARLTPPQDRRRSPDL